TPAGESYFSEQSPGRLHVPVLDQLSSERRRRDVSGNPHEHDGLYPRHALLVLERLHPGRLESISQPDLKRGPAIRFPSRAHRSEWKDIEFPSARKRRRPGSNRDVRDRGSIMVESHEKGFCASFWLRMESFSKADHHSPWWLWFVLRSIG